MKDYIVYSLRLANKLVNCGYQVKAVSINKNNPKYNIYYFEDTEELRQLVLQLKGNLYK